MTGLTRRLRQVVVGFVCAVSIAACSSGGGGSTSDATTTTLSSNDSSTSSTDAPSTTEAPTTTEAPRGLQLHRLPGRLAFATLGGCSGMAMEPAVCLMNPDGSDVVGVSVPGDTPEYVSWTWDSTALLFDDGQSLYRVNPDGSGLATRSVWDIPSQATSPDGTLAVGSIYADPGFKLRPATSTKDNPQWRSITNTWQDCCDIPRWSPDSARLLYSLSEPVDSCYPIWMVEVATGVATPIAGPGAPGEGAAACPDLDSGRWSPDGSAVLFIDVGPNGDLAEPWIVQRDGSGLHPLLADTSVLPSGWWTVSVAWSPDGSAVAMLIVHDMGSALYIVAADGSEAIEVTGVPFGVASANEVAWAPGW